MKNVMNKANLRSALATSVATGRYETVDQIYSARLQYDGKNANAMVIDHGSLQLAHKVEAYKVALDDELIDLFTNEILAHTAVYDADDFNLMGIHTYEDLLKYLQRGNRFGYVFTYRDGTKGIHVVLRADKRYIYWNNYGSSANKATAKDMKFVIETIFHTDVANFIRKYVAI